MPDPMDELEHFTTPGLTMDPLPASEVRRRGTRLRRRNNVLAGVAAVAVVAVVATPIALLSGDRDSGVQPMPQPGPTTTWVQEVPDDFPLTDGLPEATTSDRFESIVSDVCSGEGWGPGDASDVRQATLTTEEGGSSRTLALYATDRQAQLALYAVSAQVQSCVLQTDGQQQRWAETLTSPYGEESLTYANHYTDGGDLDVVQLVQVGNAILQDTAYSIGAPAQDTADLVAQRSETAVGALCEFSAEGCGGSPDTAVDSEDASGTVTIPDDFDLLAGLPTRAATDDFGRSGPDRDLPAVELTACDGSTVPTPETADTLLAAWTDPAERRQRQLMTFATDAEASAYVATVSAIASCPEKDQGGLTTIHSGAGSDLGLGDEAVVAITWYRQDGDPAPGFRVTEAVRVGTAVVVQDRIADGLNALVTSAYLEKIIGESDSSLADVVAAMGDLG